MIATSLTSSSKGELSLAIGWLWCNLFFEKGKLGNKQEEEKLSLGGFCNFSFQLHSRLFSYALDRKRFFQSHKFKRPERPCLTNKFQELLGKISMQHFLCAWQTFQHQEELNHSNFLAIGFSAEICGFLDNHSFDKLGFSNNIRQHWMIGFL